MAGNSFGNIFKLSTFGESHGKALGGVIDGCPAGVELDFDTINKELNRRRPGQSEIVTQRKEDDSVEFLSGIFEGKTTGTPIGFIIVNKDQKTKDYSLKLTFEDHLALDHHLNLHQEYGTHLLLAYTLQWINLLLEL